MTAENPSDREARVFEAWFLLAGVVLQRDTLTDIDYRRMIPVAMSVGDVAERTVTNGEQKVLSAGKLMQFYRPLAPHERTRYEIVQFVPADSFDLLRLHVWVVTEKKPSGLVPAFSISGGGWLNGVAARADRADSLEIRLGRSLSFEQHGQTMSQTRAETELQRGPRFAQFQPR